MLLTGNLSTSKDTRGMMPQGFLRSYSSEKRRRHDVFRCLRTIRQTGTPHFAHPRALSALTWSGAHAETDPSVRIGYISSARVMPLNSFRSGRMFDERLAWSRRSWEQPGSCASCHAPSSRFGLEFSTASATLVFFPE